MRTKCSVTSFLGLQRADEPNTFHMPMRDPLMGGRGASLFGGAGLAAAIVVLSEVTGRTPVWMTAQFVSPIQPPAVLELIGTELLRGNGISQGRVDGSHDGRSVIATLGAFGSRRSVFQGTYRTMPQSPCPEDCEPVVRFPEAESMHDHVDIRMAEGMFGFTETGRPTGTGRSLLWARMPEVIHDAAALAIIADYMPSAVGNALKHRVHCTSLDNTIRFTGPLDSEQGGSDNEWILCENHIEFIGSGFANGTGLLWSADGRLLATVSQSLTVNAPRD